MAPPSRTADSASAKAPDPHVPIKWHSSKFRLNVVAKAGQEIPITTILHCAFTGMRRCGVSTTFQDVHGQDVALSSFDAADSATFNAVFGLTTKGGRRPKVVLGFASRVSMMCGSRYALGRAAHADGRREAIGDMSEGTLDPTIGVFEGREYFGSLFAVFGDR